MAIPLKVKYDDTGNPCGLAEFTQDDVVSVEDGGTGSNTAEGARDNLDVYSKEEIDEELDNLHPFNFVWVDDDYTANNKDFCLVDTTQKSINIQLQSGEEDDLVIVADATNNAENNPIIINLNSDTYTIDINRGRILCIFKNNEWRVIL